MIISLGHLPFEKCHFYFYIFMNIYIQKRQNARTHCPGAILFHLIPLAILDPVGK